MVRPEDVLTVILSQENMSVVRHWSSKWTVSGHSNVREGSERAQALAEDQLVGQMCNAAVCKLLTGSLHAYNISRWHAEQHPFANDNGSDLPGTNIDVKGRLLRFSKNPMDYLLLVRPKERHASNVYVHCACDMGDGGRGIVQVIGWATDPAFPEQPIHENSHPQLPRVLDGAFGLQAHELNPMIPIRWWS